MGYPQVKYEIITHSSWDIMFANSLLRKDIYGDSQTDFDKKGGHLEIERHEVSCQNHAYKFWNMKVMVIYEKGGQFQLHLRKASEPGQKP